VIFAKLEAAGTAVPALPGSREGLPAPSEAGRALAVGAALALVIWILPFPRFVLGYLTTLVHELGHAATAWLFGYPAFPAFDFVYGGGITARQDRQPVLVLVICAALIWCVWRTRRRRPLCAGLATLLVVYSVFAASALHEPVIKAMGHGSELLFAGIFLYRALTGSGVRIPVERPLYAMVGLFIWLQDVVFSWRLIHDSGARAAYEGAKGGGHWMDFSVLAEQYLRVELTTVARLFLLATLAVPLLVWWICRKRKAWSRLWVRMLEPGTAYSQM
jgi:hypothetical protein